MNRRLLLIVLLLSFFIQAEYYLELMIYDELSHYSLLFAIGSYLVYVAYSFVHFLIIFWVDIRIIRGIEARFPWDRYFLVRILIEFFSTQAGAVLITVPLTGYLNYGLIMPLLDVPTDGLMIAIYYNVVYILAINMIFVVTYEGVFLYGEKKQVQFEREQAERQKILSQFEALRNQVNPHFLLNSMDALGSMIEKRPADALTFTAEFTRLFRYILEIKDELLISLSRELEFVKAFIYLQQVRFGESLRVSVEIDPGKLDHKLPPFSLQLLVENAIKHNEVSEQHSLEVSITGQDNSILVRNTLRPHRMKVQSTGVGLSNLKNRFAMVSDRVPEFHTGENEYVAILPLLP